MNNADDLQHILKFLNKNHVLSLCAAADGEMWSASCFYVTGSQPMSLYFMTELKTLHGTLMAKSSQVVGTIAPHPKTIALIKGIQFRGEATVLTDDEERHARHLYCTHFPVAIAMKAPVWRLALQHIKMTDNTLGFGKKLLWNRGESDNHP